MTLTLSENDIRSLVGVSDAIDALDDSLRRQGEGHAINRPRRRVHIPSGGSLQVLPAADFGTGIVGFKSYTVGPRGGRFHVMLYDTLTGTLKAIVQAGALGAYRTGAASGIATRYMSRENSEVLGVIGAGTQARTQVQAICTVRPIKDVRIYGRDPARREAFAEAVGKTVDAQVHAVETPEEAASGADVVVTATSSATPVLEGAWLSTGSHVNAIGSNSILRREIDLETARRAARVVVDDREQAVLECGDLLEAWERGVVDPARMDELGDVVSGRVRGRQSGEEITLFESQGIGLWDLALAEVAYQKATDQGVGIEVDL
jgi:alanine dehydrogenase